VRPPAAVPPPTAKAEPAPSGPVIPDTPAGATFRAWFDAFNDGGHQGLGGGPTRHDRRSDEDRGRRRHPRARVVEAAAAKLIEGYVYAEVAEQMAEAIRAHQARGDYDAIDDGPSLAARLTADLRAVSHDKHLNVSWQPMVPR
jgi:hypothetical protein